MLKGIMALLKVYEYRCSIQGGINSYYQMHLVDATQRIPSMHIRHYAYLEL